LTRPQAYQADITYGTNSEFGFDYLRDNISYQPGELRQRGHAYAIVDEIDSILIDEARTPLIISAPTQSLRISTARLRASPGSSRARPTLLSTKSAKQSNSPTRASAVQKTARHRQPVYRKGIKYVHHLETAVRAKALFQPDKEYVVRNGEVVIVDEFTGPFAARAPLERGLPSGDRGKEGVAVQKESRTFASITYQNYFRLYDKLAGMTGTAKTSSEEFYKVYGLEVAEIPTNKPVVRKDLNDLIFQTEQGKFKALARGDKELHKKGQPVLVGTVSIEKNELALNFFAQRGHPS
jgi:preprotein translocase subunit SecA